jgi:hypothetical protein
MAFGLGLPNGRSFPVVTSSETSSVVQFRSFATCAASSRAGRSFAAQVVIAAGIKPSVINQSISSGQPAQRDPTPSEADIKATRDLIRAGQILKIELLDLVIMGMATADRTSHHSLRELGYFYS